VQLEKNLSLRRTLAPEGDSVIYRDQSVHVAGYARRFLFRPEQLEMPVGRLSGGEQARALIARLMLQPTDLLLLDEPTNDLDIPTLEILEESLWEFPGALVLVTHDRFMLDRICTVVLGLDGEGGSGVFADYLQWEEASSLPKSDDAAKTKAVRTKEITASERLKRLSYLDQIEWDQMERKILEAETTLEQRRREAEDPAIASDAAKLLERHQALEEAQVEVSRLYARWAELEEKKLVSDP
jgi:ATP-binding cassette subfamily F protein uup